MNRLSWDGGREGEVVRIEAHRAEQFVTSIMIAIDVPREDAQRIASCLVRADLRGVSTHGLMRLPIYIERAHSGLVNVKPTITIRDTSVATATADGDNGFGFVVAHAAMRYAIDVAKALGIGLVSVYNSNHFGMAANYVLQATEAGLVALVLTNASPGLPPWGGSKPLLGTSPIAAGAPLGDSTPFLLDMSPAVAARGKVRRAAQEGVAIPLGVAIDEFGRDTTDAAAALRGAMLPIGGPKGSGLAMLMDVLCGVMSGAGYAGQVGDQYKDVDRPQNVGHLFLVMKPDLFVPLTKYEPRMERLVASIHNAPAAEGVDEVLLPGELERRQERMLLREGLAYSLADIVRLNAEADRVGIDHIDWQPG